MQSQYTHSPQLNANFFSRVGFIFGLKKLLVCVEEAEKRINFEEKERTPRGGAPNHHYTCGGNYTCQMN